ncbi:fibronectin type III domain-containing protein [Psychromonas sp. 14N.309.X.WAT.B.A12]|uniref:fibronectin type III domain-containing protein n=1 Tax=unclassified Psychromonas TaxID=2614957 RepID=UPI0025B26516|nr:fibronectin type III domain-containing protein [Psychromonas sp. 14N.309.X.WAT.B.A12]MDN2663069.1 fibronectin type III domain-containing protein [Psychromonas sp. 14N.309.X.WAT.B.A12]
MAFLSLTACGGEGSSEIAEEIDVTVEESFEELVSTTIDEEQEAVETASLEISWDDLADNEDGFLIERSLDGEDDFIVVTSVDVNETSYVDNNVEADSTYCYRIGAYNENGIAYSDVSCIEDI